MPILTSYFSFSQDMQLVDGPLPAAFVTTAFREYCTDHHLTSTVTNVYRNNGLCLFRCLDHYCNSIFRCSIAADGRSTLRSAKILSPYITPAETLGVGV